MQIEINRLYPQRFLALVLQDCNSSLKTFLSDVTASGVRRIEYNPQMFLSNWKSMDCCFSWPQWWPLSDSSSSPC